MMCIDNLYIHYENHSIRRLHQIYVKNHLKRLDYLTYKICYLSKIAQIEINSF